MSEEDNKDQLGGGTYELLKGRIDAQVKELQSRMEGLNGQRKEVFGSIATSLIGSDKVTTQNNCIAQDFITVGQTFIFGYNVTLGLKSQTGLEDVFAIYNYAEGRFHAQDLSFIQDEEFIAKFNDLYKYYKKAQFVRFSARGHTLYMVFRIGDAIDDLKVFKWTMNEGQISYVDDRSVHEYSYPAQHEFEWNRATRDMHVEGEHPHISIDDRVFVETVGGDLTIKVENNTGDGSGIYEEDVENKDQTLDDGDISYSILDNLILLKIRPYQEKEDRYIVYNDKLKEAVRIDRIKNSCVLLPEGHGIIFSNGYYLQNGEYKLFDLDVSNLKFDRKQASPNGEDMLYVFYNREQGIYVLQFYNLIDQKVSTPIICHGFSMFPDGKMIYFKAEDEPRKHHTIQVWQTPFTAADFIAEVSDEQAQSQIYKIGNKEVVSCMAECQEVINLLSRGESYSDLYVDVVKKSTDILDGYFWLKEEGVGQLSEPLDGIRIASTTAIDEYEKVKRLRKETAKVSKEVAAEAEELFRQIPYTSFDHIDKFVAKLSELRQLRSHIIELKDRPYADIEFCEKIEQEIIETSDKISGRCIDFLADEKSLNPYREQIEAHEAQLEVFTKVMEGRELQEKLVETSSQLEMLIETVSNLKIDDPTRTTLVIDSISSVFTILNQTKGKLKNRIKDLMSVEGKAEFNAQLKLLNQGVVNYLDVANEPDLVEEYLTKAMVQLEELESHFSEFDEFIVVLAEKRDEVQNAFEQRRIFLTEERSRKAEAYMAAADRILKSIGNRIKNFKEVKEISSYFAADMMVDKLRDLVNKLRDAGDSVRADDLESRLKSMREEAIRQLKDKNELYVEGEDAVRFGKHVFSVNKQELKLTMVSREGDFYYHLTGTRFFEKVESDELEQTREVWAMQSVSENTEVYRAEYLVKSIIDSLDEKQLGELLAMTQEDLLEYIRQFMAPRYEDNYTKGIHDHDASLILSQVLLLMRDMDLLNFSPQVRSSAQLFWLSLAEGEEKIQFLSRIKNFGIMYQLFPGRKPGQDLIDDLSKAFRDSAAVELCEDSENLQVINYLIRELGRHDHFIISHAASQLYHAFEAHLKSARFKLKLEESLDAQFVGNISQRFEIISEWMKAFIDLRGDEFNSTYLNEAALIFAAQSFNPLHVIQAEMEKEISGMVGSHSLLKEGGVYSLDYQDFSHRLEEFLNVTAPKYRRYVDLKHELSEGQKSFMRLHEFKARVLSSFVRNRLINEVYLPMVGDNLAKQMGTLGENKRTDLMGMLLLISPPGYGKTTLMEYIASCLGLVFMKINAPAIGHAVTSLDPAEAPNASAAEELKKLNLAFEMGDNVMIYLDDIQHSNPELLQKFISLCDGQRKIEGVYKGQPKTYDLRGRKVCVIMAGNPYNESGDKFQIPDMLSNRADTYNLGDIIGDTKEAFYSSYLENSMTSNPSLAKLATAGRKDVEGFIAAAEKGSIQGLDIEGDFSSADMNDIVEVLKKLLVVRDAIAAVNLEYIRSASVQDDYRTEPSFKLQGSYRNMNKITEKILPIMNEKELDTLIQSHYANESQTLTGDAEFNLLKFRELTDHLSDEDVERIGDIRKTFGRNQLFANADESDPVSQVVVQLGQFSEKLSQISEVIAAASAKSGKSSGFSLDDETMAKLTSLFYPDEKDKRDRHVVIPGKVEIVNNVPDFFSHILKDQFEVMKNWIKPLMADNMTERDDISDLKNSMLDLSANYQQLLERMGKED
ncbi:DNA repair ATPase [Lentisphaera profundi]|uniref:DNA repair ATPase n=1 Tax=Lentisphaera profundi TaxID=1658616 RepID=A0ABY7W249_9BACT|nr:DNA repair ATPase [Lentisphaera profundi]WDE99192.1 DNA repair ATPase [Lentisphaera profundi]